MHASIADYSSSVEPPPPPISWPLGLFAGGQQNRAPETWMESVLGPCACSAVAGRQSSGPDQGVRDQSKQPRGPGYGMPLRAPAPAQSSSCRRGNCVRDQS